MQNHLCNQHIFLTYLRILLHFLFIDKFYDVFWMLGHSMDLLRNVDEFSLFGIPPYFETESQTIWGPFFLRKVKLTALQISLYLIALYP